MRWFLLALIVCSGCALKPSCPPGDVGCLFRSLSIARVEGGPELELTSVPPLTAADGGTLRLSGPAALELDPRGEPLVIGFANSHGCQPAYCFNASVEVRCIPAVKEGVGHGLSTHWLELGSQAEQDTLFQLVVTPISAPGCPEDVAQRLVDGDPQVQVGVPARIEVTALRRPKPSQRPDAGPCLEASTLLCTSFGSGGTSSRCISRSEYERATGLPLPEQPAPDGTAGCFDEEKQVLVKPCMPASTCRVGQKCGGPSGGICNP